MTDILPQLLGEIPLARFLEETFLRFPASQLERAGVVRSLGTPEVILGILTQPDADLLVVRAGERWSEGRAPTPEEAPALVADGYTLLIRHAERHHAGLKSLADEFARTFHGEVDIHIYWTPAQRFGFGWHYDVEDVFILQTQGSKQYSLRKNTVNPWPLLETLPADMRYERELMPLMQCLLEAGDWLYIPHGYWHRADAKTESISLAVGVLLPSSIDVFDLLRQRLLNSLLWRQRLPVVDPRQDQAGELEREKYRELFRQLGDDLQQMLHSEAFLNAWFYSRQPEDTGHGETAG